MPSVHRCEARYRSSVERSFATDPFRVAVFMRRTQWRVNDSQAGNLVGHIGGTDRVDRRHVGVDENAVQVERAWPPATSPPADAAVRRHSAPVPPSATTNAWCRSDSGWADCGIHGRGAVNLRPRRACIPSTAGFVSLPDTRPRTVRRRLVLARGFRNASTNNLQLANRRSGFFSRARAMTGWSLAGSGSRLGACGRAALPTERSFVR